MPYSLIDSGGILTEFGLIYNTSVKYRRNWYQATWSRGLNAGGNAVKVRFTFYYIIPLNTFDFYIVNELPIF